MPTPGTYTPFSVHFLAGAQVALAAMEAGFPLGGSSGEEV